MHKMFKFVSVYVFGSYQTNNKYIEHRRFVRSKVAVDVLASLLSLSLSSSRLPVSRESGPYLLEQYTKSFFSLKKYNKLHFLSATVVFHVESFFLFFTFAAAAVVVYWREKKMKSQQGYHAAIKTHFFPFWLWHEKKKLSEKLNAW